jgi:N-acetylglucosaminyl-diphospho-decaprenol L-rhamnosyltransferase
MTVHVVMPVFNRLDMTRAMLECLGQQQVDESIQLIVVDDGSTDGTAQYLASRPGITILQGDGSLWWGGAVDLAVRHVLATASGDDWILLINNDTLIEPDFVQGLLNVARHYPQSAVGSVVRSQKGGHALLSIGPRIDPLRLTIHDRLDEQDLGSSTMAGDVCVVDALSGRGVLLPVAGVRSAGGMRPRWLPHYLADYELSLRLKSKGWRLLVAVDVAVFSEEEYGSQYRAGSLWERLWSVRAPSYLPALAVFWWEASTCPQRLTLPLRLLAFAAFPALRKKKNENTHC